MWNSTRGVAARIEESRLLMAVGSEQQDLEDEMKKEQKKVLSAIAFALELAISTTAFGQIKNAIQPALVTRKGFTPSLGGAAASPDGKWFVTQAQSAAITIWSAEDGTEFRTFQPFTPYTGAQSFASVSTQQIAVASDSRTIAALDGSELHLIDVNTAEELKHFPIASAGNWKIAANRKEMAIAAIEEEGIVFVFSLSDGQSLFHTSLPARHRSEGGVSVDGIFFQQIQFSPDGKLLAIATDKAFELWDWTGGKKLLAIDAHAFHRSDLNRSITWQDSAGATKQSTAEAEHYFWFTGLAFSPNGKSLALSSRDELTILDIPSGKKAASAQTQIGKSPGCIFLDDDRVLLPQDDLGLGIFFVNKRLLQSVTHLPLLDYIRLQATKRGLWFGLDSLTLVDATTLKPVKANFSDAQPPSALTFTADGRHLVWSSWSKPLASWDLESGEAVKVPTRYPFATAVVSGDGRYLAEADAADQQVRMFDLVKNQETKPFPMKFRFSPDSLSLSKDGSIAATSQQSGAVNIFSLKDQLNITDLVADHPTAVAIRPDGKAFAVADLSGTTIYSVDSPPKKIVSIPSKASVGAPSAPFSLRFSPDGGLLAIDEATGPRLLLTDTWQDSKVAENSSFSCLAFSPQNEQIAFIAKPTGIEVSDTASAKVAFADESHLTNCPVAFSANGKFLIAANESGGTLLSAGTGETVAALYLFGDKNQLDWLVVTPKGLFDGTPAAWKRLSWRFSGQTFNLLPIDFSFRDFYHSGLLGEILSGKAPKPRRNIAEIDIRQPLVSLSAKGGAGRTNERTLTLQLEVDQVPADAVAHLPSSGARDLRLFRNGSLVREWHGDLPLDNNGHSSLFAEVSIVAGDNHFTAYAFSQADIKSSDASLNVVGDDVLRRQGIAYVIAMGVNHYAAHSAEHPLDLKYAEADATDFSTEFRKVQAALRRYSKIETVPLLGDAATSGNLAAVLSVLNGNPMSVVSATQQQMFSGVLRAQPEDGVFIFYAGHGAALDGHFYLIPHDYDPGFPLNDPQSHTLSELALSRLLEGISPNRSFLIIDACNSGQAITSQTSVGPTNSPGLAQLAYDKGLYVMAASKNSEPALEDQALGGGHGLLTYALIEEGLKAGTAEAGGVLELRPWFEYASRRVPEMQVEQIERRAAVPFRAGDETRQHPRMFFRREPDIDPFVVAKTPNGLGGPAH